MSEIKCSFTSVWTDGLVTTPCVFNSETGQVDPEVGTGPLPKGSLEREFITLPDGDEREVCPTCHEYILKTVMGDRADRSYGEIKVCSNPNCEE
jgi:hypothetical protein